MSAGVATDRTLVGLGRFAVEVEVGNRSTEYAAYWLDAIGIPRVAGAPVRIRAGEGQTDGDEVPGCIRLWDFQVGMPGDGLMAGAVSGAAAVIGHDSRPAGTLPEELPEKWCGLYGVLLALAELWRARAGARLPGAYDVSSADVLRAFALQNSGTPEERAVMWRRNGRIPVQHGGIFPMGFYPCRDGYVALLGRSRRDWKNIRQALDNPKWAQEPDYDDPFALARDSERADVLLSQTLSRFTRRELLARGLEHEAVIAPVLGRGEGAAFGAFRDGFSGQDAALPFTVAAGCAGVGSQDRRVERATKERVGSGGLDAMRPLAGLRVLELCWVWSGPMVGQILADLGAEVIKIESLDRFDLYRTRGLEARRGTMTERVRIESSLYFHSLNRNKVGITVDLKSPVGLDTMKALVAESDLLLDNFTTGTLERLGLGDDVLHAANPALCVVSMSGPGKGSSLERLRSYGLVLSALGGAELDIEADGEFVGSPTYSLSDPNAALFAGLGALAGCLGATRAGDDETRETGVSIDLSQIEACGALMAAHRGIDSEWPVHRSAAVIAEEGTEWVVTFAPTDDGPEHSLDALGGAPAADIRAWAKARGMGIAPVLALEDTDASDYFDGAGWLEAAHPITGEERLVAAPWRVGGRHPPLYKCAPLIGEGNDYVLRHVLGLSDEEAESLAEGGQIG